MENVIDLVCSSHNEIGEHSAVARKLVEAAREQGTFTDAGKVVKVLDELTVEHFRREEAMMRIIERDEKLAPGQREYYAEVREEHGKMSNLFHEIKELGAKYDGQDSGLMKDFFDKMVDVGVLPADLDYTAAYTLDYANSGVSLEVKSALGQ